MTVNTPSDHASGLTLHASPLDAFFTPTGVAVIGASANPNKLSYGILRNLTSFGYRGAVYPVNPGRDKILGLPCYPTITAVPDPLDLAVIVVPAPVCPAALHECGVRGVKGDLADFQLRPVVGRTLGTPYRTDAAAAHEVLAGAPRVDTTTHPIAVVEAALREVGLRATARGKLITIVDDRGRVATLRVRRPARVAIAGMTLRSRDNLVSIDVARALVPLYGPLRLSGPLLGLLIDGTRSRDEVIAEADAQFHKALGVLQQGLERTGAIMSQVQDSLRRRR